MQNPLAPGYWRQHDLVTIIEWDGKRRDRGREGGWKKGKHSERRRKGEGGRKEGWHAGRMVGRKRREEERKEGSEEGKKV